MINTMGVVEIYDDFLTDEQCKNIIKSVEDADKSEVPFGFEDASIGKGHKGGDIRSNKLINISSIAYESDDSRLIRKAKEQNLFHHVDDFRKIHDLLGTKMQQYVNEYTAKYEFPIMFDEGYTMLRYQSGQSYKGHSDYAPHIPRYLSALILLNPHEYEGGGTYFHYFDENIKPEKPSLVLFPSNYAYTHQAMPVVSGTKYAIVTWLGHRVDLDGMPNMYRPEGM